MDTDTAAVVPPFVATLQAEVDVHLSRYLEFGDGCPPLLREAIRYAVLAPGKRLRPMLVLLSSAALGGTRARAMPAACAVELIHAYSLVHDDLPAMDDDVLRRGRPTCHVKYGEATAILVGDALIPLAFEILARDIDDPRCAAQCCAALAKAAGAEQLVGGQADDLNNVMAGGDSGLLESIHLRKTAALIAVSLRLGGIVSAQDEETLDLLEQSGKYLGLAFQIADDLLDLSGNSITMGKAVRKDQERGKLTYPQLWGIEESQRRLAELTAAATECWKPWGDAAQPLKELAEYLLRRTH